MMAAPKVAIVGAGPAGLLLANILERHTIPYAIFELSDMPRTQGGTLDLHPESGQAGIHDAGLWEDFTRLAHPEADVRKLVSAKPSSEVVFDENTVDRREVDEADKFDRRPEIDRGDLLQVLLGRLPEGRIRWSHKLAHVVVNSKQDDGMSASSPSPVYDLEFADGKVERGFGLVVGADGAWSKVRNILTDQKPEYSGISGVSFHIRSPATEDPWVHEYAGAGSNFSFGRDRAIQSQRQGSGAVRAYAWARLPENFVPELAAREHGIDWSKPQEARDRFLDTYFQDFAPDMVRLVRAMRDESDGARALYHFPVGFHWTHRDGNEAVTLLGDAAHVMTPFAGVGVNAAFADAKELGKRIVAMVEGGSSSSSAIASFADVVADYEREAFPRAVRFATRTAQGLEGHFQEDGSERAAAKTRRLIAEYEADKARRKAEQKAQ